MQETPACSVPGARPRTPRGQPHQVFTHDFPHLGAGKAIPYATYDIAQDQAVVNVGVTHDTAEFAVESIRHWWRLMGKRTYPKARRLLISADAGGSNGNRLRAWKGQPLVSYEAVVILIGHTRSRGGLRVKAVLDTRNYETGQPITQAQMQALNLKRHVFHPTGTTRSHRKPSDPGRHFCKVHCLTTP